MGNNIFTKVVNINAKTAGKFIGPVMHCGASPPGCVTRESQVRRAPALLPHGRQTAITALVWVGDQGLPWHQGSWRGGWMRRELRKSRNNILPGSQAPALGLL